VAVVLIEAMFESLSGSCFKAADSRKVANSAEIAEVRGGAALGTG